MSVSSSTDTSGTNWIYDPRVRSIISQVVVIGAFVTLMYFIVHNTAVNLEKAGIASGFDFLWTPARYDVTAGFMPVKATQTHWDAFMAGLLNTFVVAIFGCLFATMLGVLLGVLRLSKNWLISNLAAVYVETIRNIPVLLQILFWYGIFILMPRPKQSFEFFDTFFMNNRGILGPKTFLGDTPALSQAELDALISELGERKYNALIEQHGAEGAIAQIEESVRPVFGSGSSIPVIALIIAIIGVIVYRRWARKKQEATGQQYPTFWPCVVAIIGLPVLAIFVTGTTVDLQYPELKGFNFVGGFSVGGGFLALWFALSLYTAAFIGEIVRAGILAVSHGQTEASFALGVRPSHTTRLVVLPQALRVIIPPLTSQYLNLTKNSSLALVVGYPDVVGTIGGITLNQTGQAVECIVITMAVYLTFSLVISMFMNWYNSRIALVER